MVTISHRNSISTNKSRILNNKNIWIIVIHHKFSNRVRANKVFNTVWARYNNNKAVLYNSKARVKQIYGKYK